MQPQQPKKRRALIHPDPIRAAWRSGDFARADSLASSGLDPAPATLRRMLSPGSLGERWGLAWGSRPNDPQAAESRRAFGRCLARCCERAPEILAERADIAGQMRSWGFFRLALNLLCEWRGELTGKGHLDDGLLLARAAKSLCALDPAAASLPRLATSDGPRKRRLWDRGGPPLWTRAPALPDALARELLASARARGALDAAGAWEALGEHVERGVSPMLLRPLLDVAKAPDAASLGKLLAAVARSHHRQDEPEPASSRLWLVRQLLRPTPELARGLDPWALLGGPNRRKIIDIPAARLSAAGSAGVRKKEAAVARGLLDWLDGCAALCAELGCPDLAGGPEREQSDLWRAYRRVRERHGPGCEDRGGEPLAPEHPFPLGPATIQEAFNLRKGALELAAAVPSPAPAAGGKGRSPRAL